MKFMHEDRGRAGLFTARDENGEKVGEISYSPAGLQDALVFDHTYVPEAARGQGIARKLVDFAVDHARARNLKVVPACSYVRALFERHREDYADVATEEEKPWGRV